MKEESEPYLDEEIPSNDAKVPGFLKLTYLLLPIWGVLCLYYYANGSHGWLDRGYWHELQRAANTTFPIEYPEGYQPKRDQSKPYMKTD